MIIAQGFLFLVCVACVIWSFAFVCKPYSNTDPKDIDEIEKRLGTLLVAVVLLLVSHLI